MNLFKAAEMVLEAWDWDFSEPRNKELRKRMKALRQALAQPEQEPVGYVFKATNHYGETAHFGVRSAAKAWAKSGTVEMVPIKIFKVVQKPCSSCESLARTVMLDQTYHESIMTKREWIGLTDEDKDELLNLDNWTDIVEAVEAKLKEKNT